MAALRNRNLAALTVMTGPVHIRVSPLGQGVGQRGLAFRGALKRGRFLPCVRVQSRGPGRDDDAPFSLRDSETLGNIGVIGVLATAVVVGGALVIFNPYAKQNVQQETIEVAEVPTPLPAKPEKSTPFAPAAPSVAPPVAVTPPAPAPKKAPPSQPAVQPKKAVQSGQGGVSTSSLVGGFIIVAALSGGVAYYSRNMTTGDEVSPETNAAPASNAPSAGEASGEPAAAVEKSEDRVAEAREWISEWREGQK